MLFDAFFQLLRRKTAEAIAGGIEDAMKGVDQAALRDDSEREVSQGVTLLLDGPKPARKSRA